MHRDLVVILPTVLYPS